MVKIKYCAITFLIICFAFNLKAQDKVVQGIVTILDSFPLIGANIKVNSTNEVTQTDSVGFFSVTCNSKDVLMVSADGFYGRRVKIKDNIKYAAINLKPKPRKKNKYYDIGYGYVSDENKLNALSRLTNNEEDFSRYSNVFDIIKGRFSGVRVDDNNIYIRGITSIVGDNTALIVIDGIISQSSDLATIPTTDIKSINVIKDGGAAIYGVRGSNGVVIIETRKAVE